MQHSRYPVNIHIMTSKCNNHQYHQYDRNGWVKTASPHYPQKRDHTTTAIAAATTTASCSSSTPPTATTITISTTSWTKVNVICIIWNEIAVSPGGMLDMNM